MLAKRFGAMGFLGWGMFINSIFAFLVPVAARNGGVYWLCVIRFIQGLGEGPIVPCTHAMLAKWIPPNERSRMGAAVYAGENDFLNFLFTNQFFLSRIFLTFYNPKKGKFLTHYFALQVLNSEQSSQCLYLVCYLNMVSTVVGHQFSMCSEPLVWYGR